MNIFRYEVTDKKGALIAALLRTLWFATGLLVLCLVFGMKPLELQLTAGLALYVVIVGFTLDHWKLRHQSTSRLAMVRVATVAMLVVLVALPLIMRVFRK